MILSGVAPLPAPAPSTSGRLNSPVPAFSAGASLVLDEVAARVRILLSGDTLADRVTPECLAALLQMSPEGEFSLDEAGRAQLRDPGSASAEDQRILAAVTRVLSAGGDEGRLDADDDFFEAVTGYRRLELGGGLYTYVDAAGAGAPADSPAWQLGPLIEGSRRAGVLQGEVSQSWFDAWAEGAAKIQPLPSEWLARAEAWFADRGRLVHPELPGA